MPALGELDTNAAISRAAERVKNATANVRRLVDIENLNANLPSKSTNSQSTTNPTSSTMPKSTARQNGGQSVPEPAKSPDKPQSPANENDALVIDFNTGFIPKWSCNQIRTKINTFINNGGMKVGEFQDRIGVSPNSYHLFLKQSGPHAGVNSDTYGRAHVFFAAREQAGLKMPRAKKAAKPTRETEKHFSVDDAQKAMPKLDGEERGAVPVYDTCDGVRKKIDMHLRKSGVTQAAFARELSKCVPGPEGVSSKNVTDFRNKRGVMAGNTSKAFYAAYVYFEKLRVQENKPKSKKRQEMEAEYGRDSVDLERDHGPNARMWLMSGESASINKYGKMEIHGR